MVRCAFGCMLETLSIHRYSPVRVVKIRVVQTISREVRCSSEHDPSETKRRTSQVDDDMVPSAWRHVGMVGQGYRPPTMTWARSISEIPCQVSSDLHEWCNDWSAVSTRDSVKLNWRYRCRLPAAGRKDPVELYYSLMLTFGLICVA